MIGRFKQLLFLSALGLVLSACGARATTPAAAPTASRQLTVGLGYIPNVQFTPFYVAQARGYYRAEGLEVELQYGQITDLLVQVEANAIPLAIGSGDEVLLARSQGIDVTMVFLLYQRMPIAIFGLQGVGLREPADLRERSIGIPGRFGATYIGLQGLLAEAGIPEQELDVRDIGFTQAAAVSQGQVDLAVGYAMNEPVVLANQGQAVEVLEVSSVINLVSNGVIAGDELLRRDPELAAAFVRATARGLRDTLADPEAAFQEALQFMPELQSGDQPLQLAVLKASLPYWQSDMTKQHGLGYNDPQAWSETYDFLRASGLLAQDLEVEAAYSNDLLPGP